MDNTDKQFEHLDNYPIAFGKYDRWHSRWQVGGGRSDAMLRCRKAPSYLFNSKTGEPFIGKYRCYRRPCRHCGVADRNRIGNIVWAVLTKDLSKKGAILFYSCRASEWRPLRRKLGRLGADWYKVLSDTNITGRERGEHRWQTVYIFANQDFSTRQYADKEPLTCERIDNADALEEKLQRALAMPPRVIVRPGGKYPKTNKPRSEWRVLTHSELLTEQELQAIEDEVCPGGIANLKPKERFAAIKQIGTRIIEAAEQKTNVVI